MTDQMAARRTIELRIYDLETQKHAWGEFVREDVICARCGIDTPRHNRLNKGACRNDRDNYELGILRRDLALLDAEAAAQTRRSPPRVPAPSDGEPLRKRAEGKAP